MFQSRIKEIQEELSSAEQQLNQLQNTLQEAEVPLLAINALIDDKIKIPTSKSYRLHLS